MNRLSAPLLATLAFLGLPAAPAFAQLEVAESLLVDLDASSYTNSSTWANAGSLSGNFTPQGTPTRIYNLGGQAGVFLDGTDYFDGPATSPTLDAPQANYSIEVWAYQGYVRAEETLVAWSNRGGPTGTNVSFNYGSDDRFGAMGHWGAPDLGWGPNDPVGSGAFAPGTPAAGEWHHLVYTYDGAGTQRVYKNGVLMNSESNLTLDPHDARTIRIGAQSGASGAVDAGQALGGVIGKVRIHAGTLDDAQVAHNFSLDAAAYRPAAPVTQTLAQGPRHRYTFNNLASGAEGTVIPDVVGGADGVVRGVGAGVSGSTGLTLPGGSSATQAYVDLPNGVASGKYLGGGGYEAVSYEAWLTISGTQNWSRMFDFGTSTVGEVAGPGGSFSGNGYVMLTANTGTAQNIRLEVGGISQRETQGNATHGVPLHVVVTFNSVDNEWRWYRNGVLMEGFTSAAGPADLDDVNNWLGRSNFSGDGNLFGIYDEFRIYDYALSPDEVQGNFLAGADVVNVPEPGSILLLGVAAAGLGLRRRRQQR